MELEERTLLFIVRIWTEPREIEQANPQLRGVIENVYSGQQRYFKHLDELVDFILPHLQNRGVRVSWRWRLRQWLKR
jgi:hypothetical protein